MQKLPTPTIKILETELSADKFNKKKQTRVYHRLTS